MNMQSLLRGSHVHPFWASFGRALVIVLGVLVLSSPLVSQSSMSQLLGVLTDPSRVMVVGATVEITDVQRGVTRSLTTDGAGEYLAPNLEPGVYQIVVTKACFKRFAP